MKCISEVTYNNIISLLDNGLTSHEIAAQLNISHTTVNNMCKKAKQDTQTCLGGQPTKLKAADKHMLVWLVTLGKADTATQLVKELKNATKIEVSVDTVCRALKGAGMKASIKKKKPWLQPQHICQHLEFTLQHQHWTIDDWKHVIWSDETKINHLGSDGRNWVWTKPGNTLTEQQV